MEYGTRGGLIDWLAGGPDHAYHTLPMCMDGDAPWAFAFAASGLYVFASYMLIVGYFLARYRKARRTSFARAMLLGALTFLWCGASGYLMGGAVSYYWPARRLETLMRLATGTLNLAFAYHLCRISFLETVLSIDAKAPHDEGTRNVDGGR